MGKGEGVAAYPLNQAARRAHDQERAQATRPPAHPKPEVPARPAQEDEIPIAAKRLRKAAEASGFTVAVWYARGTPMYANGKPGKRPINLVSMTGICEATEPLHGVSATATSDGTVCVERGGVIGRSMRKWHFVAAWEDNSFQSAYAARPGDTHATPIGARALRALVDEPKNDDTGK